MAATPNKNAKDRPLMPLANPQFELISGKGFYLYAKNKQGKELKILNWSTGIACEPFGSCFPAIVKPVISEKKRKSHSSLTYETAEHLQAGRLLLDTFDPKGGVIFSLDGMKANEIMLKGFTAYHEMLGQQRSKIIVFEGAFHGRSVMECAATGKYESIQAWKSVLEPLFIRLPFNNIEAVENAANSSVAGIIVEPIQGESGISVPSPEFLPALRKIADKHGIVLGCDEVQSGMMRAGGGRLFAHQLYGIKPDMLSLAKALGGGVEPVGATLFSEKIRSVTTANEAQLYNDGATFSGMPPAMVAVIETLKIIQDSEFQRSSMENEKILFEKLEKVAKKNKHIVEEVRGRGFFLGLKLKSNFNPEEISNLLKENGLSTQRAGGNVIRILPPLNTTKPLINKGIKILNQVFATLKPAS